jgi:hypothetical protein
MFHRFLLKEESGESVDDGEYLVALNPSEAEENHRQSKEREELDVSAFALELMLFS